MPVAPSDALKPRKTPRQARSAATVEAIFEAAIQVLLVDGYAGLTTTRVAARAGVSVGTMYQYFPHKEALLYAVLEDYLEDVIAAMEQAALRCDGAPLAQIADDLCQAYLEAKLRRMPGSRVLYAVADTLETASLVNDILRRADNIVRRLLSSASDARFADIDRVTYALRTMLVGTVRAVLENDASPEAVALLRAELPVMCRAYLLASAAPAV